MTKALERSDKYIEELETELEGYRGKSGASRQERKDYLSNGDIPNRKFSSDSKVTTNRDYSRADNSSRRQLFSDDMGGKSSSGEGHKYYYEKSEDLNNDVHANRVHSAKSKGSIGAKKKVTFDLDKNTNSAMSFDLELPSPLKTSANGSGLSNGRASPVKGVLKKKPGASDRSNDGYSTDLSKTLEDSLSESYDRYKTDKYSKDDDLVYLKSKSRTSDRDMYEERPRRKLSADDSMLSEPSDIDLRRARERDYSSRSGDYGNRRSDDLDKLDRHDLDDTQYIESELDELNISVTPEFTDCMKILNRAEKNVNIRDPGIDEFSSRLPSSVDTRTDTAFRSSTGSIGNRPRVTEDDYLSSAYKTDTSKFTSSLDTYSRARHVRSGSLDNLLDIDRLEDRERPSSALPTTTNMYPPTSQSKYSSGLTTGRTTLTRTPSFDNLIISRPDPLKTRAAVPGYLSSRFYHGENNGKVDVAAGTGYSSVPSTLQPVAASHDILGTQVTSGLSSTGDGRKSLYDPVGDGKLHMYTTGAEVGLSKGFDVDKKLPPSGRSDTALPLSSTGMDFDKPSGSGRITPTIPTHSEYMSLTKVTTDRSSYSNTNSGRSTPILTNTEYSTNTNSLAPYPDYRSSGPSSLPTDLSQKPPTGVRQLDPSNSRPYTSSYSSTNTLLSYNSDAGDGYSSLPRNLGTSGRGGVGGTDSRPVAVGNHADMYKYGASLSTKPNEYSNDKHEFGASANYRTDSNVPKYNDQHYRDGTDFSNFSTKVAVNSASKLHPSSMSSANSLSASSTGPLSYPGSSYLASSLTSSSATASTSYSMAHSVPLTHTTSSYTSSVPSNTYVSKPLEPITETGHYSYVSNVSGDYSSKNDTFALPEPKKRLFENSDDLDMSMSPIKSNRRY